MRCCGMFEPEALEKRCSRCGSPAERGRALIAALKDRPCADCGGVFPPVVMQFDHLPGHTKVANLSRMSRAPEQAIREEAAKCDVVCANCHAIRGEKRRLDGRAPTLKGLF